jgi:hypothetical protein
MEFSLVFSEGNNFVSNISAFFQTPLAPDEHIAGKQFWYMSRY